MVAMGHPLIWMLGDVVSYDAPSGALEVVVSKTMGAGTFSDWQVMLVATEQLDDHYVDRLLAKATVSGSDYFLIADEADAGKSKKLLISELLKLTGDVGDIKAITWNYDPVLHSDWLVIPTAPTNISRTAYPELLARWGTKYGAGDGATTFCMYYIPANYALLQAVGGNHGTNTVGEVIAHTHSGAVELFSSGQGASGTPN